MKGYLTLLSIYDPSSLTGEKLVNIVTKEEISQSVLYLNFTLIGRDHRLRFIKERFQEKTKSMFAPIFTKHVVQLEKRLVVNA